MTTIEDVYTEFRYYLFGDEYRSNFRNAIKLYRDSEGMPGWDPQIFLAMAIDRNAPHIVEWLLTEGGADPNILVSTPGWEHPVINPTPLHLAVSNSYDFRPEMVKVLLKSGADPSIGNPTPLEFSRNFTDNPHRLNALKRDIEEASKKQMCDEVIRRLLTLLVGWWVRLDIPELREAGEAGEGSGVGQIPRKALDVLRRIGDEAIEELQSCGLTPRKAVIVMDQVVEQAATMAKKKRLHAKYLQYWRARQTAARDVTSGFLSP